MTTLLHLKNKNANARDAISELRKTIGRQRNMVARAGQDAGGDPEIAGRLTAQRVDQLRELEGDTLTRLAELRAIERETRAALAGGLGVTLTAAERAQAVELKTLYGDQTAGMSIAEFQEQLQAAVLRDDRAGQFFWSQASGSRLLERRAGFGSDTSDRGREEVTGSGPAALDRLVSDVNRTLLDRSADPVIAAADQVRDAVQDLRSEINTARANRGEGPAFGHPSTRTATMPGTPIYDATGSTIVDYAK